MIVDIKELKYFTPLLYRIKVKPTLFNWFPCDKGILEFEYCKLHGNFLELAKYATGAGVRFRIDHANNP